MIDPIALSKELLQPFNIDVQITYKYEFDAEMWTNHLYVGLPYSDFLHSHPDIMFNNIVEQGKLKLLILNNVDFTTK